MCKVEFGIRIDGDFFKVSSELFELSRHLYDSVVLLRGRKEDVIMLVGEIFTERKEENEE